MSIPLRRRAVDRLDALVAELIGRNVEVILVGNASTTRAAQRATKTIPLVMVTLANPVGNGFVASLAKPGGNITGITSQQEKVLGKLIGVLHEVTPGARRVAIMLNEGSPMHSLFWATAQRACSALDLIALRIVASAPAQLAAAVARTAPRASDQVRNGDQPQDGQGLLDPRVIEGGVVRHEVEHQPQVPPGETFAHSSQRRVAAQVGMHRVADDRDARTGDIPIAMLGLNGTRAGLRGRCAIR